MLSKIIVAVLEKILVQCCANFTLAKFHEPLVGRQLQAMQSFEFLKVTNSQCVSYITGSSGIRTDE